jgi:hypothetical protein
VTYEQMKEIAETVVNALNAADGIDNAQFIEEDATPGEPLPIAFNAEGQDLVLNLDVL